MALPGLELILASASPRRAELLSQLGVRCLIRPANIDEKVLKNELAQDYVRRLAEEKSEASAEQEEFAVLAADTVVVSSGDILGKPENAEDAQRMLWRLSGGWHEVYTGIALRAKGLQSAVVVSRVKFKALSEEEIGRYLTTPEPFDKAGAYGIQGLGALFVERIEGSYSNVMGLPLFETEALFARSGLSLWQFRDEERDCEN
jgi:septum formation protein